MSHEWELRAGRPKRYNHHEVVLFRQGQYDGEWPPTNAIELVEWLNNHMASVPEQYRSSVYMEIDSTSHYATVKVAYRRPETDEELGARVARYEAALRDKEAHDRAEFDRLSKKFS